MPNITVETSSETEFKVTVTDPGGQTTHTVTVDPDYARKLTGGKAGTAELVERSFEFLLEREPKESILRRFDLPVIARYFPEYEREIKASIKG
jgi:hypothetical protein